MKFSQEQLDITDSRLMELEKTICILQENITTLSEQLRETQRYLIKLAHNQAEITKRVSTWPYLAIEKDSY
jgi:uncharacterized coiled-coil protein SlyX